VGDARTAPLVSSDGSIDRMCAPSFDSPPVFGSLVAGDGGGSFAVTPAAPVGTAEQAYLPGSTVLCPDAKLRAARSPCGMPWLPTWAVDCCRRRLWSAHVQVRGQAWDVDIGFRARA
jgi:hypothetical protein